MPDIKAALFDIDGTLGDTLPLCLGVFKEALAEVAGRKMEIDEIRRYFGPSEEGVMQAIVPEKWESALETYLRIYAIRHDELPGPFEGIVDLLDFLKGRGVFLGVVTAKGERSARITLEKFGLSEYFGALETGSAEGCFKEEGIERVRQTLGCEPCEMIYVGDMTSDVDASKKAGVRSYAVAWASTAEPERLRQAEPDALFTSVPAMLAHLRKEMAE